MRGNVIFDRLNGSQKPKPFTVRERVLSELAKTTAVADRTMHASKKKKKQASAEWCPRPAEICPGKARKAIFLSDYRKGLEKKIKSGRN